MTRQQRWQYFKDYYLLKTIIIAAAAAVLMFLCWHFFFKPKQITALYVAVMDDSLDADAKAGLTDELSEYLSAKGKKGRVVIDDDFYMNEDDLNKLEVYLRNSQVDVIISDRDTFTALAGCGFFTDLTSECTDGALKKSSDRTVTAAGYKDTDEVSMEDHETGQGEVLPYGIDISESVKWKNTGSVLKSPVASIAYGAPDNDSAEAFICKLLQQD